MDTELYRQRARHRPLFNGLSDSSFPYVLSHSNRPLYEEAQGCIHHDAALRLSPSAAEP